VPVDSAAQEQSALNRTRNSENIDLDASDDVPCAIDKVLTGTNLDRLCPALQSVGNT